MSYEIEQLLNKHGVKPTPQRAVIAEYLMSTMSHPTADEVFQAVENKLPVSLSRATVYNTLNTLVEKGVIREVVTEAGKARYDANISDHHHFVDLETGQVMDVPLEEIGNLPIIQPKFMDGSFEVQNFQITFFGKRK
ncbi:MAG: transcriptional repressor [Candidatus Melainabacteria bacterium]|jgi:Fe2+ or Zn2+ uptake regulation protein|nr:transcriptional repressor [Candidatus Melainabacteria bacterium]